MDKKNKVVKKPYDFYLKLPAPIVDAIFLPMTVIETLIEPHIVGLFYSYQAVLN